MKKLILGALSIAVAGSLTACGSSSDHKSSITYAMQSDMVSLDSAAIDDGSSIEAIKASNEGLMSHGRNGETINGVAKKVDVSKNGKTYTFHLRHSQWSDGSQVTADDFVYGWQRIFKVAGNYIYMFGSAAAHIKNADQLMMKAGKKLSQKQLNTLGVKAKDKYTLVVKLTKPVPFFKQLMTFTCFRPIKRSFAEKQGKNYGKSASAYLSNGPFKVTSWTNGSKISFVKNKDYYDADDVKLDQLTFRFGQKTQAAAASYDTGKVDVFSLDSSILDKYKKKDGFYSYNTGFEYYLLPNLKNKALANKNIRLAISLAINRKDFVNTILKNGSTPAKGFVPADVAKSPSGVDFRKDAGSYSQLTYNRKKASDYLKKGLKQLGKSSITLRLLYGTDEDLMSQFVTYVQNSLSKLKGLKVNVVATTKQDRVNNKQANGDFDLSCTRWGPDYADPTTYLNLLTSDNSSNYGKYKSKRYDADLNKAYNQLNAKKRWSDLVDAERIAMKDLAVIPVFNQGGAMMINPEYKGIYSKPMVGQIFRYAYKK